MEDQQIIRLFFERSEQAITELSRKYGALCFQIADNILDDPQDAEECVNDAWLGAWNSIPPQRPDPLLRLPGLAGAHRPQPLFEKAAGQFRAEAEQPV